MGNRIDKAKMPSYYVEEPVVNKLTCGLLERSTKNIIGERRKNRKRMMKNDIYMNFVVFQDTFYSRLRELEGDDNRLTDFIDDDIETNAVFLGELLKIILVVFRSSVLTSSLNKLDSNAKKNLKRFCKQYKNVKLECYGIIGEALFHAMQKCDQMYGDYITHAWINGYSLFLRHFLPYLLKIQQITDDDYTLADVQSPKNSNAKRIGSIDYCGVPFFVLPKDMKDVPKRSRTDSMTSLDGPELLSPPYHHRDVTLLTPPSSPSLLERMYNSSDDNSESMSSTSTPSSPTLTPMDTTPTPTPDCEQLAETLKDGHKNNTDTRSSINNFNEPRSPRNKFIHTQRSESTPIQLDNGTKLFRGLRKSPQAQKIEEVNPIDEFFGYCSDESDLYDTDTDESEDEITEVSTPRRKRKFLLRRRSSCPIVTK